MVILRSNRLLLPLVLLPVVSVLLSTAAVTGFVTPDGRRRRIASGWSPVVVADYEFGSRRSTKLRRKEEEEEEQGSTPGGGGGSEEEETRRYSPRYASAAAAAATASTESSPRRASRGEENRPKQGGNDKDEGGDRGSSSSDDPIAAQEDVIVPKREGPDEFHRTTEKVVVFDDGPMGMQLEPVVATATEEVEGGCARVCGFLGDAVTPSPARDKGIAVGDVILSINGSARIGSYGEAIALLHAGGRRRVVFWSPGGVRSPEKDAPTPATVNTSSGSNYLAESAAQQKLTDENLQERKDDKGRVGDDSTPMTTTATTTTAGSAGQHLPESVRDKLKTMLRGKEGKEEDDKGRGSDDMTTTATSSVGQHLPESVRDKLKTMVQGKDEDKGSRSDNETRRYAPHTPTSPSTSSGWKHPAELAQRVKGDKLRSEGKDERGSEETRRYTPYTTTASSGKAGDESITTVDVFTSKDESSQQQQQSTLVEKKTLVGVASSIEEKADDDDKGRTEELAAPPDVLNKSSKVDGSEGVVAEGISENHSPRTNTVHREKAVMNQVTGLDRTTGKQTATDEGKSGHASTDGVRTPAPQAKSVGAPIATDTLFAAPSQGFLQKKDVESDVSSSRSSVLALEQQQQEEEQQQRRALSETEKEVRTLRASIVTLNSQLETAQKEVAAQRMELDRATAQMEKHRAHHASELAQVKSKYERAMNEAKRRSEEQLEAMRKQVQALERQRKQEVDDRNKELADAVQREKDMQEKCAVLEDEKAVLLSQISTLQEQQEALGNHLEALTNTAESVLQSNKTNGTQKAEDNSELQEDKGSGETRRYTPTTIATPTASGLARVKNAEVLAVKTKVEITPEQTMTGWDDSNLTPLQKVLRVDLWSEDFKVVDMGLQRLADMFDTTNTEDISIGEEDNHSLPIAGGISVIVGTMRKWRAFCDIQVNACTALDRIVTFGYDVQDTARDAGAIEAIVWGMKNYPNILSMQTAGMSALGTMMMESEFNAIYLEKGLDGINLIIETMKNHRDNSKLQSLCLQVLSILSNYHDLHKPIVEAGGLSTVSVALETHTGQDDEEARLIQGLGRHTLLRLSQQLCDEEEVVVEEPQQRWIENKVSPYNYPAPYSPAQDVLQDEGWKARRDRDWMIYG